MPTYEYNPKRIKENGVDRMRFELGDTTFNPAELTAALSNEEYQAVIDINRSWKRAKLAALEAILMKFAHSCTTKIGPISYSFSDRVEVWKDLYSNMKHSLSTSVPPNVGGADGKNIQSYFYEDMQSNYRKG